MAVYQDRDSSIRNASRASEISQIAPLRRKKNVKKGLQFTIMVCGSSGTGRTTFINTICGKTVLKGLEIPDPRHANLEPQISIKPITVDLEEDDGTRISLTIVDTPGFGDNIDNEYCFAEIYGYLEHQYDEILAEESRIRRNPRFKDSRVHVCLYFIEPTGHGLRELDVELMKKLSRRVNIIPVIGRSDTLTPKELAENKRLIMQDIDHYAIAIYNFPYDAEEDDTETIEENSALRSMLPFAVVSSTELVLYQGQKVRARQYPWGVVVIDNPAHCEYSSLRSALLGSHLSDLKDITHDFLYENYRTEKLSKGMVDRRGSSLLNPEDLANQSYILKEEQLHREEEKLKEIETRVQREINEKRMELHARELELREIESRIARERSATADSSSPINDSLAPINSSSSATHHTPEVPAAAHESNGTGASDKNPSSIPTTAPLSFGGRDSKSPDPGSPVKSTYEENDNSNGFYIKQEQT